MKRKTEIIFVFCSLLLCFSSYYNHLLAQTAVDSISTVAPKFLISNQKGRILLVFDENRKAWEIPGLQYAGPISFKGLADKAAEEFGIEYKELHLAGLFTYHYPNRYKIVVRPYFSLVFTGFSNGKEFNKAGRFQWCNPDEVKSIVPYPASVMIVEQIIRKPKVLWAGAFEEYGYTNPMTDPSVIKFRVVEPFYKLK